MRRGYISAQNTRRDVFGSMCPIRLRSHARGKAYLLTSVPEYAHAPLPLTPHHIFFRYRLSPVSTLSTRPAARSRS